MSKKLLYAQASKGAAQRNPGDQPAVPAGPRRALHRAQSAHLGRLAREGAQQGNTEALTALRVRQSQDSRAIPSRARSGAVRPGTVGRPHHEEGTIIFRIGMSAVRDDGDRLQVSRKPRAKGCKPCAWHSNVTATASQSMARLSSRRRSSAPPSSPSYHHLRRFSS